VLRMQRPMKNRLSLNDSEAIAANDRVRINVECLMEMRRLTQVELCERLDKSQPWLSKRLTGTTPFQIEDLDLIGDVFGLSPAQLLQEGYGKRDRRCGEDRRTGADRRQLGERFDSVRGRHRIAPQYHGDAPDPVRHDLGDQTRGQRPQPVIHEPIPKDP
jgi:transcriptional regulator with XRE-family HTH domain